MDIKKKKISQEKEKRTEESSDQEEISDQKEVENMINRLCHQGEMNYHILVKWTETNLLLERIANAEEKRNDLMLEGESEEDDSDSDEED
ncbi:MAG: hypothetical protein EHM20_00295 [Alphaproteobacteria bacterium]|nr:MAG: hypothetical protein EHM20_00295 [Alphaproteobacteria bacterium]